MKKTLRFWLIGCSLVGGLGIVTLGRSAIAQEAQRQWSDAGGKFQVLATLQRTEDGYVYLKAHDGRSLRIAIARLSPADQAFLQENNNPFEPVPAGGQAANAAPRANGGTLAAVWNQPLKINWDKAPKLRQPRSDEWQLQIARQSLPAAASKQPISLGKKASFFENVGGFTVNPRANRAAIGFTLTTQVPEPLSRVTLIDLASAKSLQSVQVTSSSTPLCLLNDGSTVLMHGIADGNEETHSGDQLQLWRLASDQVDRSARWVPFQATSTRSGKPVNSAVVQAIPLNQNRIVLRSYDGHLACIDAVSRQPQWMIPLHNQGAVDVLPDQSLLAAVDGNRLLVIDPYQGQIMAALTLGEATGNQFRRVAWSADGKQIAATLGTNLWIIDASNGNVEQSFTLPHGAETVGGLSFLSSDHLLISGTLLHLPTQLWVCHYWGAKMQVVGGRAYVAVDDHRNGVLTTATLPHPAAAQLLSKNESNADKFLLYPGVKVAIDASAAGPHAAEVTRRLTEAIQTAGYELVPQSDITLIAEITAPVKKDVRYIMAGTFSTMVTQSYLRIRWQDRIVWNISGSNEPGSQRLKDGESLQQRLANIAQHPNLGLYNGHPGLPKLMQRPNAPSQRLHSEALMTSQFTPKGMIDEQ